MKRCRWCEDDEDYVQYHDTEWGVPVVDDVKLFEFLTLEGAQAGLSWITVLKKREAYKKAFTGFDPSRVATFSDAYVQELMQNSGIIRNRLKIESTISNAKLFLLIQKEYGSFARYLWSFTLFSQIKNSFSLHSELPSSTPLSEKISKDLKKKGFRFVGPTIVYALMQAIGMVNDHLLECFRYDGCTQEAMAILGSTKFHNPEE